MKQFFRIMTVAVVMVVGQPASAIQFTGPFSEPLPAHVVSWYRGHFAEFKRDYLATNGRVIDRENGGISHSEGQAYGMLIALLANEPKTFERIWQFTKANLKREDELFSWKYVDGHGVVDPNNATDADVMIASALGLAADRWKRSDYLLQAAATADAIGSKLLVRHKGRLLLTPAAHGFGANDLIDGPVINLSYYHFAALRNVAELAPQYPWDEVIETGLLLMLRSMELGTLADWTSVADPANPLPAQTLPSGFSYDAIRVAWNLLVSENQWRHVGLRMLDDRVNGRFRIRTEDGVEVKPMTDPGYRILAQTVECAVDGGDVPYDLFRFDTVTYYSSALHLMTVGLLYADRPECIPA